MKFLLTLTGFVALRKESVDRNEWIKAQYPGCRLSLSARRAWIEIVNTADKEARKRSLSARRAWIEINHQTVDFSIAPGRSPQGERG